MTNPVRIVNLTRKRVLDPKFLNPSATLRSVAVDYPAAMGGLIHLLATPRSWSGERIVIVGPDMAEGSLPHAEEICGVPAQHLFAPAQGGHSAFAHTSKKVRRELTQNYRYAFTVQETTVRDERGTSKEVHAWANRPGTLPGDDPELQRSLLRSGPQDVVIVNTSRSELIDPRAFGNTGSLADLVVNPGSETLLDDPNLPQPGHGLAPAALALLLAPESRTAEQEISAGLFTGRWAGERIAVMGRALASLDGDITLGMDYGWIDISTDVFSSLQLP